MSRQEQYEEAYRKVVARLERAEKLLHEIRDGKHSLPGTLVQIDRYFTEQTRG